MRRLTHLRAGLLCVATAALAGCGPDPTLALRKDLLDTKDRLRHSQEQNLVLRQQLHGKDEQIQTLQGLSTEKRMDQLFTVHGVRIGGYSTGANLDGKPGDDGVKVFVEPVDQHGSTIKAAGEVTIQLYDLAAPADKNLLSTHTWSVDKLHDKWTSGFMASYYIFEFPFAGARPRHDKITVRVQFVDYLTGKTFSDQKVVQLSLPPPATQPATAPAKT